MPVLVSIREQITVSKNKSANSPAAKLAIKKRFSFNEAKSHMIYRVRNDRKIRGPRSKTVKPQHAYVSAESSLILNTK